MPHLGPPSPGDFSLGVPARPVGPLPAPLPGGMIPGTMPLIVNPCPPGFQLQQVQGVWVCAPSGVDDPAALAFQLAIQNAGGTGGGPGSPEEFGEGGHEPRHFPSTPG